MTVIYTTDGQVRKTLNCLLFTLILWFPRSRSRERYFAKWGRVANRDRDRERDKRHRSKTPEDKFKGSLSEGLKVHEESSDEE